jgi:hypothetical protein
MIDTSTEAVILLGQVPAEIPSRHPGKRINVSTVWRWAMQGCRGVLLESIVIGGGRFTSREAIQRFAERLSTARPGGGQPCGGQPGPVVTGRSVARRQRESAEAGKRLEAMGA